MSKKTAELDHVHDLLRVYGARTTKPKPSRREVTHRYEIDGNLFTYTHGASRGNSPTAQFERDLKRAHRNNCHQRGLKPSF